MIKQKRQVVTTRDINNIIRDEQQWALYYYVMGHYIRMGFIYIFPLSLFKKMSIISWNKVCNKLWLAVVKPSKPVREMMDNIWKKNHFSFFIFYVSSSLYKPIATKKSYFNRQCWFILLLWTSLSFFGKIALLFLISFSNDRAYAIYKYVMCTVTICMTRSLNVSEAPPFGLFLIMRAIWCCCWEKKYKLRFFFFFYLPSDDYTRAVDDYIFYMLWIIEKKYTSCYYYFVTPFSLNSDSRWNIDKEEYICYYYIYF